jgi:hypothetical protein
MYNARHILYLYNFIGNYYNLKILFKSRDSSVSIVLVHELDNGGCRVQFLVGAGNLSLHHYIQNSSGAHPASYPMGTRGSFREGKEAGA